MKPYFVIGACCALAASFLAAIAGPSGKRSLGTIEKKGVYQDIVMLATLPEQAVAGDATYLKIRMENQGKKPVSLMYRSKYWDYDLVIFDRKGQPVPLTRFGKHAYADSRKKLAGETLRLTAGKHVEATLNLARVFDLTNTGEYTVNISREIGEDPKGGKDSQLKIEKLKFEVVEQRPAQSKPPIEPGPTTDVKR